MAPVGKAGCGKSTAVDLRQHLITICNCDKIVVMGDGRAVEQGTHEQLLRVEKRLDHEGKLLVGAGFYHTLRSSRNWQGRRCGGRQELKALQEQGVRCAKSWRAAREFDEII